MLSSSDDEIFITSPCKDIKPSKLMKNKKRPLALCSGNEKVHVLKVPSFCSSGEVIWKSFKRQEDIDFDRMFFSKKPRLLTNRPSSNREKTNEISIAPCNSVPKISRERRNFIDLVKEEEMKAFFRLLEDELIQDFLEMDSCKKICDKYLLAMVFAYFKRAEMRLREYRRMNFFLALYLANDMEEDDEEAKYEIFPWALGTKWKDKFPKFLRRKDLFWKKIGFRAVVSRRCCEEIMNIEPGNPLWKRVRPDHHGGAIRSYTRDPDDDGFPRGPYASPRPCKDCDSDGDSQYNSASSDTSISCYLSSDGENSPKKTMEVDSFQQLFDLRPLEKTLKEDNAWPFCEE